VGSAARLDLLERNIYPLPGFELRIVQHLAYTVPVSIIIITIIIIIIIIIIIVGLDSVVGTDGPRIEPRWGRRFSHLSWPALESSQPVVQRAPGVFPEGKAAGAWCWPPPNLLLMLKKENIYTSTPTQALRDLQ
jgi:hypothetical protein